MFYIYTYLKNTKTSFLNTSVFFLFIVSFNSLKAQNFPISSSFYSMTTSYLNPASASSRDLKTLTASYSQIYAGVDGSPTSQILTYETPFGYNHGALAFSFSGYSLGPQIYSNLLIDYAQGFMLSKKNNVFHEFHLGLRGGVGYYSLSNSDLLARNSLDPFLGDISEPTPNIGFGILYKRRTAKGNDFRLGISIPSFSSLDIFINEDEENSESENQDLSVSSDFSDMKISFHAISNLNFKTGGTRLKPFVILFIPSILIWYEPLTPLKISYNLAINLGRYSFLTGYDKTSIIGGVNFLLTPLILLSYSYKMYVGYSSSLGVGTHELVLRYDILEKTRSTRRAYAKMGKYRTF